jgi:Ser/Thr protein kinase RdoA (MazF antagonist)
VSTNIARRLFAESGLASSHEPVGATLVGALLEEHYGIGGELARLATEKDDTFRLRSGSGDHLVKVSPPGEPVAVVAMQTAAMRFLDRSAPDLPDQRVVPTRDGDDSLAVPTDEGRNRVLRVFDFVDGPVLARTTPDAEQLAEVGAVLGRLDVALARFTHPADGRGLVWDIRHFHHLTGLVEHTPDPEHRRAAARSSGSSATPSCRGWRIWRRR